MRTRYDLIYNGTSVKTDKQSCYTSRLGNVVGMPLASMQALSNANAAACLHPDSPLWFSGCFDDRVRQLKKLHKAHAKRAQAT